MIDRAREKVRHGHALALKTLLRNDRLFPFTFDWPKEVRVTASVKRGKPGS